MNTITIPRKANIKVYWDDKPENYSRENKLRVRNHFALKYGVDKEKIKVIYRPVKYNEQGDVIEITGAGIENIMDKSYQRGLMKEWIKRENKDVDFDRILKLDDKVNAELTSDFTESRHRNWSVKWLMINNFLSFGEANYLPFNKLKGLTVVNSLPGNQGGKTSLTIDSLKFLLHGNTTKTDKNEDIFNKFSDKNEVIVRGMIVIDERETIIERKMKRTVKKGGGWTVTNKINYFDIMPDGEEKTQNDEDAKKTTITLRETIGSEKDFEMLVLATEKNLEDLIGLTTTESGKILTRLIGLEVIEVKEGIVRKMYNEFDKKKKSNEYDVVTLTDDIKSHEEIIELSNNAETQLTSKLTTLKAEIIGLNNENDRLLNSKNNIDVSITSMNPANLEKDISEIKIKGVGFKDKIVLINKQISDIGLVEFDEDKFHQLSKNLSDSQSKSAVLGSQIKTVVGNIKEMIEGGICKGCNRALDNIDNSGHLFKLNTDLKKLEKELTDVVNKTNTLSDTLNKLNESKKSVDSINRLELDRDRTEVEVGLLRNKITEKMTDLKRYKLNLDAIEMNRKIDIDVSQVKTNLAVSEFAKDETIVKIQKLIESIKVNQDNIVVKRKLIETINKECEIDKIYKLYIDLVGKKGIGKLVLRSVLPIINSEVERLLSDVCDFDVEVFIDDKNDVQFNLTKDGVINSLKSGSGFEKTVSSLALRAVLGKLSILPMPNFITFDEVLGKVANENLEKLKPLFDKISNMYEIVFLITHSELVKDWGDVSLTIIKESNISRISLAGK